MLQILTKQEYLTGICMFLIISTNLPARKDKRRVPGTCISVGAAAAWRRRLPAACTGSGKDRWRSVRRARRRYPAHAALRPRFRPAAAQGSLRRTADGDATPPGQAAPATATPAGPSRTGTCGRRVRACSRYASGRSISTLSPPSGTFMARTAPR